MRVLYANHTGLVSGGELSLIGLLESPPEGVEAAVACPEGELARRVRELGVEILPIGGTDGSLRPHPTRTPRAVAELGRAAIQLRRAASRFRPDLVHANSIRAGIVALGARAGGGPRVVVHVRDCLPPGPLSTLTLRTIARADALVANSGHTRSRLGPATSAAHVVHNAVDLERFDPSRLSTEEARARCGLDGRGPVLAVIAQITPWKGQDDAIRIAGLLRRRHPDLRLLLVGSPKFDSAATRHDNRAFMDTLRVQVAEEGLRGQIHFLGERDDVPEILRAVDLLLAPSWEEPFGRAVVEAMAAGVPVAATSVGGPREVLDHGRSGLLLPPREPALWAREVEGLLDDPARLATMGRSGREEAGRRFGAERHAARVLDVYRALLSGEAPRAGAAAR